MGSRAVFEKGQFAESLPTPHGDEDRLFAHRHHVHCPHLDEEQRISDLSRVIDQIAGDAHPGLANRF